MHRCSSPFGCSSNCTCSVDAIPTILTILPPGTVGIAAGRAPYPAFWFHAECRPPHFMMLPFLSCLPAYLWPPHCSRTSYFFSAAWMLDRTCMLYVDLYVNLNNQLRAGSTRPSRAAGREAAGGGDRTCAPPCLTGLSIVSGCMQPLRNHPHQILLGHAASCCRLLRQACLFFAFPPPPNSV